VRAAALFGQNGDRVDNAVRDAEAFAVVRRDGARYH